MLYVRTLPGRSQVWFNADGRHVRTVDALQQYTEFRWGLLGSGSYLQQIVAPYTTAPHDTTRYVFEYNNNPAATVRNLSRVVAPGIGGTRSTEIRMDAIGRLLRIYEPAENSTTPPDSVSYAYASGLKWMGRRTDRRGGIHNFSYVRTRFHTSTRQLNATENAVTRVQAVQTLGMLGSSVRADSVRGGSDGPRTEFCDCSVWGVDRWGAHVRPRRLRAGHHHPPQRHPVSALVTETNAPNGFATTAAYDTRGNLASTTAWNPYGDQRNATTTFRWHPYWDKPVQVIALKGARTHARRTTAVQLKSYLSGNGRAALISSVISAVVLVACGVMFGTSIGMIPLGELLGSSIVLFTIVLGFLFLGGRKGLGVLWVVVGTFLFAALYSESEAAGWTFARAVRMLPDVFVLWSMLAIPLGVGTVVFLRDWNPKWSLPYAFAGCAIWLVLLMISSFLARHAPDVGNNPRDHPIALGVSLLLIPFAIVVTAAFLWKVTRVPEGLRE